MWQDNVCFVFLVILSEVHTILNKKRKITGKFLTAQKMVLTFSQKLRNYDISLKYFEHCNLKQTTRILPRYGEFTFVFFIAFLKFLWSVI